MSDVSHVIPILLAAVITQVDLEWMSSTYGSDGMQCSIVKIIAIAFKP